MSHPVAIALMTLANLMWSIAGAVSRQLQFASGLTVTCWRSVFATLTVALWLAFRPDARPRWREPALWVSGALWAAMFTCFTVALSLTRVANVLIMQSLGPIFTALLAWRLLGRPVEARTGIAIAVAVCGVIAIVAFDLAALDARHLAGMAIALGIPIAAAMNWVLLQRMGHEIDLSGAVMLGAAISALATSGFAAPAAIPAGDLGWLALLGVVQLGIPCVIATRAARRIPAPEMSLLGLLEVVFGVALTWALAGERPSAATLIGGSAVLAALAFNELARPAGTAAAEARGRGEATGSA